MYPFERFSEKAKKVLTLAQDEAEKSHHSYIGTEHLLLGLLREEDGLAAKVLANLGVEIHAVRDAIDSVLSRDERVVVQQIIPTSRVKKVIELAFWEAQRMGNTLVGTEHLLLGLIIEGEGVAAHVLEDLGASLDKVRHELGSVVEERGSEDEPSSAVPGWVSRPSHTSATVSRSYVPVHRVGFGDLELLTSEAKSALALGEEEAVKARVGYFGPEHLLAGLVRQGEGQAAHILTEVGVTLERVRAEWQRSSSSPRSLSVLTVRPTRELRRAVFEVAPREAEHSSTERVDTEHLLLAITEDSSSPASRLLEALGVDLAALRKALPDSDGDPRSGADGGLSA